MLRGALFAMAAFIAVWIVPANAGYAQTNTTEKKATQTSPSKEPQDLQKFKGHVKKIDGSKHTIKIRVGDQTRTFSFNDKTVVVKDEKHVPLSAIKKGNRVSISADSSNFARKIKIEPESTTPE